MEPSEACYQLAEESESLQLEAYPDPGTHDAPWTIGFGHTKGVKPGDTCTPDQAKTWLREDMADAAAIVNQYFPAITQGQFDALTDFCFNVGPGVPGHKDGLIWLKSGEHSTLMKFTLQGRLYNAGDQFLLWVHAGGEILPGLVTRREKERALFLS